MQHIKATGVEVLQVRVRNEFAYASEVAAAARVAPDCGLERRASLVDNAVGVSSSLQQEAHHVGRSVSGSRVQWRSVVKHCKGCVGRNTIGKQQPRKRDMVQIRAVPEPRFFLSAWSAAQASSVVGRLARVSGAASVEGGDLGFLSLVHPCRSVRGSVAGREGGGSQWIVVANKGWRPQQPAPTAKSSQHPVERSAPTADSQTAEAQEEEAHKRVGVRSRGFAL